MTEIKISTNRKYEVCVGSGLLASAGKRIVSLTGSRQALILTDSTVAPIYGSRAVASLRAAGMRASVFVLPAGEQIKNSAMLFDVIDILFHRDFCRDDVLVTLGGGTVSDLGGLAASLYMRGMRLIHIPTTLLGMVAASIGGKTAIDLPYGKSMVGTFYQPDGVIDDLDLLATLPQKQLSCGYAEVIRCAALDNKKLFSTLEDGDADMEETVSQCIKIKEDFISDDENDRGKRHLLGLGNTYASALESFTDYKISHGYAISIGIAAAFRYACATGRCDRDNYTRVCALLRKYHLPTACNVSGEQLWKEALSGRNRNGKPFTVVVPLRIGKAVLQECDDFGLRAVFGE